MRRHTALLIEGHNIARRLASQLRSPIQSLSWDQRRSDPIRVGQEARARRQAAPHVSNGRVAAVGYDRRRASERHSLEWSGMIVRLPADRKLQITVGGMPIDEAATYRVATNSFLAWGGDGFTTFGEGKDRVNSGVLLRDAIAKDLARRKTFAPPKEPRLFVEKTPR